VGVLVILSHPDLERSIANRRLAAAVEGLPFVRLRHLERLYPDGRIDVGAEQDAADAARAIAFQFCFNWYSTPPALKRWMDDVLAVGWAYGPGGRKLRGKPLQLVVTCGAAESSYAEGGYNRHPIAALLLPIRTTAEFVGMRYAEPLILFDVPNVAGLPAPPPDPARIDAFAARYRERLAELDTPSPG
jgi:glutathione-regulated potassium-efflux system ancillary protein KefF